MLRRLLQVLGVGSVCHEHLPHFVQASVLLKVSASVLPRWLPSHVESTGHC